MLRDKSGSQSFSAYLEPQQANMAESGSRSAGRTGLFALGGASPRPGDALPPEDDRPLPPHLVQSFGALAMQDNGMVRSPKNSITPQNTTNNAPPMLINCRKVSAQNQLQGLF